MHILEILKGIHARINCSQAGHPKNELLSRKNSASGLLQWRENSKCLASEFLK